MNMNGFPLSITDWSQVPATKHPGETGFALWHTQTVGDIRVRMVEYSPGYSADHWCSKGHIILCLEGELETKTADGQCFTLSPGCSYQVSDGNSPHRSSTRMGAKLFIVD
jgi:quercetin dioxygenase-like cupin family protein